MKNKNVEIAKKEMTVIRKKLISRKDAIKRIGYLPVSAATMMSLLSKPNEANGNFRQPLQFGVNFIVRS